MKSMIISPHPDDETLGAGGSILKLKDLGNQAYWLNVTDVETGGGYGCDFIEKRKVQISKIRDYFGFEEFINLKFPPANLNDSMMSELINDIGGAFDRIKPDCIILPDYNDAHSDHKYVFEAAYACSKVFRRSYIKRVLTMEIISETNFGMPYDKFKPNLYIDVTDYFDRKIDALRIYDTELGDLPFPRSVEAIKAQAVMRGTESGVLYAEAFRVIKEIE
ncbi:MAG: PIG-L family deacetylase [Lachnospiraceae bacterium]|nr:PIG-L family deacetylase [Lachnospiraceae bacterium]